MGGCAAAYGGVVVRSLSCEAMRSMKVLSIPAVVFLFGFGYVVNFTAVSLFIFGFGFFCSYLGEFSLTIFRFSYCEALLFHSVHPLKIF